VCSHVIFSEWAGQQVLLLLLLLLFSLLSKLDKIMTTWL
jgi:hypothetical protein